MVQKNIVVPCDGTWNGVATTTNVRKLSEMIRDVRPAGGVTNVLPPNGFFPGIGIGRSLPEFLINGAVASDISYKIKEAYKFIATEYSSKGSNSVWLFGFSRGAYTVRSVAGMIRNCGIPIADDDTIDYLVDQAYDIYRNRGRESHPDGPVATEFRESFSHHDSDRAVVFLGIWDTVGAHGIPSYAVGKGFEYLEFYDQFVSSYIKYTYHALAVHENLANFEPCRIFKRGDADSTLVEKWFPGVHIDIGGFVHNNPISDTTLNWMIDNINYADVTLGGNIPHVELSEFPAGLVVRLTRNALRMAHAVRLVFRDRVIPGVSIDVLYNGGNWQHIARSSDYTSKAYDNFRRLFTSRGAVPPPELIA